MNSVRIQTGDTERIEAMILDGSLDPITGKTDILLSIRRVSDGYWFDFDAGELDFKNSGWTTRQKAMTETDSTNDPGVYHYDFDTSTIDNPAADDTYEARVDQSPGTDAKNVPLTGEIKVGHFIDDIDQALSVTESNIRGGDGDDLQDLSVQLDTAQTDLDNPGQYKADVSALAIEANVEGHVVAGLGTYTAPTKAELDAAETNIIAEVDANETKIDAITTTLSTMVTDIWSAGTRTLTSFGTLVSDITTSVWAAGARTLTSFGTLVTDIWAHGTRTLTSFGTLVADVAAAVWLAVSRTLTGEVDIGAVKGVGVTDVDDFKADVSALATTAQLGTMETNIIAEVDANEVKIDGIVTTLSTMVADVWGYGTRTLTSFGTLVADVATAVWAAGSRTLTGFGTLAADIWAYATRTLTSFGTLPADVDTQLTASHGSGLWTSAGGEFLEDIQGGRWKIDTALNQMIFYKADNVTEVARFDLFDQFGVPAHENVYERRRAGSTTTTSTTTTTTTTS